MRDLIKNGFFAIFVPILVEQFMQTVLVNVNVYMASVCSDNTVAALSQANQILMVAYMTLNIVPMGGFIILNQLFHSKNSEKRDLITVNILKLNFIISLVISFIIVVFSKQLLILINTPSELIQMSQIYMIRLGLAMTFLSFIMSFGSIFRANNMARIVMINSIITNIINATLSYLVVFTPFSLLGKDITGIANASLISKVIATALFFVMFAKIMNFDIKNIFVKALDKISIVEICKLGIPSGLESISYNISQMIIASMIATLGAVAISSKAYALTISSFAYMLSFAMAMSTQIIVAREIGRHEKEKALKMGNAMLKWSLLIILSFSSILALLSPFLTKIFTDDPKIIETVIKLLMICVIIEPGRLANTILNFNLNAAGDVKYPVTVAIIVTYSIVIPLNFIVIYKLNWGIYGYFAVMMLDEWLRASFTNARWRGRKWQNIDVIKQL